MCSLKLQVGGWKRLHDLYAPASPTCAGEEEGCNPSQTQAGVAIVSATLQI
jgi:hypothetical protein